jgi:hypothetical protein
MRIFGTNAAAQVVTPAVSRRAASGGFSLGGQEPSKSAGAAPGVRTIGGIDALLALQGADDPTERRRRAIRRGGNALDALDELKLALLSGDLTSSTLLRLKSATADLTEASGDARVDCVLAEIGLRLEVELAKLSGPK